MNKSEQLESFKEAKEMLEAILGIKERKYKIIRLKIASWTVKDVIKDNMVYNAIKDYIKNVTLGNCRVTKKYIKYLIALVDFEIDNIKD